MFLYSQFPTWSNHVHFYHSSSVCVIVNLHKWNREDALFCIWLCLTVCHIHLSHLYQQHSLYFTLVSGMPLYENTICLSIHMLMDIWVVISLGLWGIKPRWTFMCESFCGHRSSLFLSGCQEMELLRLDSKCMFDLFIF